MSRINFEIRNDGRSSKSRKSGKTMKFYFDSVNDIESIWLWAMFIEQRENWSVIIMIL